MCQRITCSTCQRPTWTGCGQHIEQALAGVAVADRCQCAPAAKKRGLFSRRRDR